LNGVMPATRSHLRLIEDADLRPGASRIDEAEEKRRVLPVVRALACAGVSVSIDTTRARTAESALAAGAMLVNDVSGGLADPDMGRVVADAEVPYVAMHWRGPSESMARLATYKDVVSEVVDELTAQVDALLKQGLSTDQIVLDPGLGFAKRPEHDWALLVGIDRIRALGFPVLIGASRKSFLGELTRTPNGVCPPDDRDTLTAAVTALAVGAGISWFRVHDVKANRHAILVAQEWRSVRRGWVGRSGSTSNFS